MSAVSVMSRLLARRVLSLSERAEFALSQQTRCFAGSTASSQDGPKTATPPPDTTRGATADLCDVHVTAPVDVVVDADVQICEAGYFRDLGGNLAFSGEVATVKCFENNPLVRKALEEEGRERVLVVDGGASKRCALLGDNIAEMVRFN